MPAPRYFMPCRSSSIVCSDGGRGGIVPGQVERAELRVVVWDGGAETVRDNFMLNGEAFPVAETGRHDVLYRRLAVPPSLLRRGKNTIELLSSTDHHGIEVLLPGPAIVVRTKGN